MRVAGLLVCLAVVAPAQQPQLLQAEIRSVRLHPGEAWVTRMGRIGFQGAGNHIVQIGGLPQGLTLDDVRIQAKGPEGTTLGELRIGTEPPRPPDTAEARVLLARLTALHDRKAVLEVQQAAAERANGFLDAYQENLAKSAGASPMPAPGSILETSRSLEARYAELALQSQARKVELQKIDEDMKPLEASWQSLQARLGSDRSASRLSFEVISSGAGEVEIQLSTRTTQARWKPSYEARLLPGGKLELSLFAAVSQLSGESWDRIQLEISSTNLNRTAEIKAFNQDVRLNWVAPPPVYPGDRKGIAGASVEVVGTSVSLDRTSTNTASTHVTGMGTPGAYIPPKPVTPLLESVADLVSDRQGMFRTYRIEGRKDLPSDGETRRYKIASVTVPAQEVVVVAPRLDATAHSVVRFQVPTELPIFPGSLIAKYVGQQRMGQGILDLPPAGQPMQINLGVNPLLRARWVNLAQIQPFQAVKLSQVRQTRQGVSRESVKEEVVTKGADRTWTLRDEFILTNDAANPLQVELQDRLVSSVHESVSVRVGKETTPGSEEIPSQHVRVWRLILPPRAEQRVTLGLEIHAPKDGQVMGLQGLGLQ